MLALLWRRRAADAPIASTRRRPRHDWFRTPLLVAHDEAGYRRVVVSSVKKNDGIVELGSHVGVTTALARGLTDGLVVGVEMSEFSVAAARERYADQKITLLLIDVSGSRDPGFVLTLAHKYARCFPSIRLILMKSFKVASIVENTCVVPRS